MRRTPGAAAVCPELRHRFAGWERADSIVVNPHKWLATPMDCSALWTRRVEDFRRAFSLVPEYLRSPDDALNLSEVSVPLGRRFRALKLWAVLRCYGRSGLQEHIREHVRLADAFAGWVRDERRLGALAPRIRSRSCASGCDAGDEVNEALMERVNASGEVFLSHTRLHGRFVLRLAIGNFRTTEDDVRLAWDVLRREAGRVPHRRLGRREGSQSCVARSVRPVPAGPACGTTAHGAGDEEAACVERAFCARARSAVVAPTRRRSRSESRPARRPRARRREREAGARDAADAVVGDAERRAARLQLPCGPPRPQ